MKTFPLLLLTLALATAQAEDEATSLRTHCAQINTEDFTHSGGDGWLFLKAELRHVAAGKFWGEEAAKVSKATKPENADPLPAILDFKAQLAAAGVDLILVPVPPKAFLYPEAVKGGIPKGPLATRVDPYHQQFIEELRKHQITVVDLLPEFMAQRDQPNGSIYCKTDSHWAGAGINLAAKAVADLVKAQPWYAGITPQKFIATDRSLEVRGDLQEKEGPLEKLTLRFVGTEASSGKTPVAPDKKSPVILLGDSHNLIFHAGADMHAVGAGFPDQLALELGLPVDLIAVRGSGATPARVNLMRRIAADPAYLSSKKVVIWCLTEREFTEASGWAKVPLSKK